MLDAQNQPTAEPSTTTNHNVHNNCFLMTMLDLAEQDNTRQLQEESPMLQLDLHDFCKSYYELLVQQCQELREDHQQHEAQLSIAQSMLIPSSSDSNNSSFLEEASTSMCNLDDHSLDAPFLEEHEITSFSLLDQTNSITLEKGTNKQPFSPFSNFDPAIQPDHSLDALSASGVSHQSLKSLSSSSTSASPQFINTIFTSNGKRIEKIKRKKIPKKQQAMQFNFPMWTFHISSCSTSSCNSKNSKHKKEL
ncbi:hypothetical protein FDP41_011837 [Naegleria fowleri]|uniref:Uncharacterized protein n=1 Tax=Naegleria fowleri TaxID=5763 RepID=A0A6A5C2Q1_NAEFO|nr:uncharacterized protein FDP41_011837 [Naegleria fowleri]KAF0981976.1 hypothetical protein FDP41_011837 [Naegleria fowleri]